MRFPANIKRGIASIVQLWLGLRALCTRISQGRCGFTTKKAAPDKAIVKATGIPVKSSTRKTIATVTIRLPPSLQFSGALLSSFAVIVSLASSKRIFLSSALKVKFIA
jgi:hypothetical protein